MFILCLSCLCLCNPGSLVCDKYGLPVCQHRAVYIVNNFFGVTNDINVVQGKGDKKVFIIGDKYYLCATPSNEGFLFNQGPCPENLQKKKWKRLEKKEVKCLEMKSKKGVTFLESESVFCFNCKGNHKIENCDKISCLCCRVAKLASDHTPSQCIYIPKCEMCEGLHDISQCREKPCSYCKIMGLDSDHSGNVCQSYKVYYFS